MTARRLHGALILSSGLGLALVGACFVEGFELADEVGGATSTAGVGGGGGQAGAGGTGLGCGHAQWPDPPANADPGVNDQDFVVVGRSLDFGETDLSNGPLVGYDLDTRCTCQGEGDSCREPDWATADHCDGPQGRDNAIAQLFGEIGTFDEDFTSAHYTERAEQGKDSLLMRVRDYNGQLNDDQVTVSLHPTQGTRDDPCNASGQEPAWDGNDLWSINASSLNVAQGGTGGAGGGPAGGGGAGGAVVECGLNGHNLDDARYIDRNAWVNEGVLVANLPDVVLEFTDGDDSLPVQLKAGFVTGRLEQQGSLWYLREGLLVGRWTLEEFFKMIGSITNQEVPICTDSVVYPLLKSALCKYPDIASELVGPTTPCDALSFGMTFEAYPARIGTVMPYAASQRLCPPETDPIYDNCDNR